MDGRRRRLRAVVLLTLMVAVPIGAVAWLGVRTAALERQRVRTRLAEAAASALEGIAAGVLERLQGDARELDAVLDRLPAAIPEMRRMGSAQRLVRQVFLADATGALGYPSPEAGERSTREIDFLERTRSVWEREVLGGADGEESGARRGGTEGAWLSWAWGAGTAYLYYRRSPDGSARGVEVEGAALLADVISALPDTPLAESGGEPPGAESRLVLAAADGAPLYQWGSYAPAPGEVPLAGRRLEAPLSGWELVYYASPRADGPAGSGSELSLLLSVVAFALLLAGGGVYLWREGSRDAREALRRTSFVSRVSHELKTPLTNIRLYAELMERRLEVIGREEPGTRSLAEHLEVIVDESRRLSRLITNVLSFARSDRGALEVRRSPSAVDDIIRSVISDFRPSLEQRGVSVQLDCRAAWRVWADADALEQILANLVGNVEKYAAGGGYLSVTSRQEGSRTEILVADHGPGIPAAQRERVFRPFYRISSRLSEGASGTGIGLAIARDLARLHGGDVQILEPADGRGALFVVTLDTPVCEEGQ